MLDVECYGWTDVPELLLRRGDKVLASFETLKFFDETFYHDDGWTVKFEDCLFSPFVLEEILKDNDNLYLDVMRIVKIKGDDIKYEQIDTTYGPGSLISFSDEVTEDGEPAIYRYAFIFKSRKSV